MWTERGESRPRSCPGSYTASMAGFVCTKFKGRVRAFHHEEAALSGNRISTEIAAAARARCTTSPGYAQAGFSRR